MKAVVDTLQFKEALKTVLTVCKSPTITECMITFGEEGVIVEGAIAGTYVRQVVSGTIESAGAFVTNANYLCGLRLLSKQTTMESIKNRMRCVSGKARYDVEVIQDTTRIESQRPLKQVNTEASLPANLLGSAIAKTSFAPSLNAPLDVRVQMSDDTFKLTVNDEFRAAYYKAILPNSGNFEAYLPVTFLSAIASRFKEGILQIGASEGLFMIKGPSIVAYHPTRSPKSAVDVEAFVTQLDIQQAAQAILKAEGLSTAIENASSIVVGAVGYEVKLEINFAKNAVSKVYVQSAIGEAECEFAYDSLDKDNKLVLSSRYLSEFLRLAKGTVHLDMHPSLLLIQCSSPSEQLVLIMPQIESGC